MDLTAGWIAVARRLALVALISFATGCRPEHPPAAPESTVSEAADEQHATRDAFGTRVEIVIRDPDAPRGREAIEASFAEIERLDRLWSDASPASELAAITRNAGGNWQSVSTETLALLQQAGRVAAETDGAFDPTSRPLARAFGFAAGEAPRFPANDEISAARSRIDWRALAVDAGPPARARLARAEMELDLGRIRIGAALDRAAAVLRSRGVPAAMLRAGTEALVHGGTAARPWLIEIESARPEREIVARFDLQDGGVSTVAPETHEIDGERIRALLDPRTGRPASGVRSVSVVGPDAASAAAWSEALFVLGHDAHGALAKHPELQTIVILSIGLRVASPGLGVRFP